MCRAVKKSSLVLTVTRLTTLKLLLNHSEAKGGFMSMYEYDTITINKDVYLYDSRQLLCLTTVILNKEPIFPANGF